MSKHCFEPAASLTADHSHTKPRSVPLGTGYELSVVDAGEKLLLRCRAKVAVTQEGRIGLRFVDVEREAMQALRAEVARLSGRSRKPTKDSPAP